jgi:uncharacterized protein (TIGR03435 family)
MTTAGEYNGFVNCSMLLTVAAIVSAQPAFDVASIKPSVNGSPEGGRSRIEYSADSVTMRNVDLKQCVQWAYRVEYYQIPERNALDGKNYDILAKAAGAVPGEPVAADASSIISGSI